jgi:hypothetical protein
MLARIAALLGGPPRPAGAAAKRGRPAADEEPASAAPAAKLPRRRAHGAAAGAAAAGAAAAGAAAAGAAAAGAAAGDAQQQQQQQQPRRPPPQLRPRYDALGEPNTKSFAVVGEELYTAAQLAHERELADLTAQLARDRAAAPLAARLRDAHARKLQALSRHLNGDAPQCLQLLSGSLDLGTPGEYTLGSLLKLMAFVRAEAPPGADDVFCDVGSGLGRPVFAAVLSGTFHQAVGVEIVAQQVAAARRTAAAFGVPRVEFLHLDASKTRPPFDATHLYVFSQGFDGRLLRGVAAQLNAHRTWVHLFTATPPERWAAAGLRFDSGGGGGQRVLTGMTMVGSGRAYCMYVIRRQRRRRA